jgi:hypothetical protein
VKFSHSTLTLGGAGETQYDSPAIAWQNKMDALWFASPEPRQAPHARAQQHARANLVLKAVARLSHGL